MPEAAYLALQVRPSRASRASGWSAKRGTTLIVSAEASLIWIGDIAELGEDAAQLAHPPRAQVLGPLRLHFGDRGRGQRDGLGAAVGDPDEAGAGVRRVGDPLHVAGALELVDEKARRLLGDLRLPRQVGQAAALRRDAL